MKDDELDDFELNEEEQRFNNMLDGIEEDYDELIEEHRREHRKELTSDAIFLAVGLAFVLVLVVVGFVFELYTIGSA